MKVLSNNKKRLHLHIDINVHCHIKKIAAIQNITITEWVKVAIAEKLKKEMELGF